MTVKTYSYSKQGNTKLSTHFQVKEFASKSGNKLYSDTVKVDTNLITALEKIFTKLKCKYIVINSGYRTATHDKAVGGSGSGKHCKGQAADIVCYDQNGKVISAKIVCCVAQDLGIGGIANISSRYQAVHIDVRTGKKYYGDEIKSYNTVTNDFYKYFNVSKADVAKYTCETISKPKVTYFKKYTGKSASIVDALKTMGVTSTLAYRKKIATANGIKGYLGLPAQNTKMLNLLKNGKLIKP